jgi:Bax protein
MKLKTKLKAKLKIICAVSILFVLSLSSFLLYVYRGDDSPPQINFSEIKNVTEKKSAFFAYLQPKIYTSNSKILALRQEINALKARYEVKKESLTVKEVSFLTSTASTYKILNLNLAQDGFSELLKKIDIVPPSLTAAQAANESAWGTSRFATKGNNYFGQWCFKAGCGLVPNGRTKGAAHEVRKFDSVDQSVQQYMFNINSHEAYQSLRTIRKGLRKANKKITGVALSDGLTSYSERGEHYVKEIKAMIKQNNLSQLDLNPTGPKQE